MIRKGLVALYPTAAQSDEERAARLWWLGLILGALSAWIWWRMRGEGRAVEETPELEPLELPSVAPELPDAGVREVERRFEPAGAQEPVAGTKGPTEPDDLTRIEGVGPRVQEILNEHEVLTYADLAATHPEHLRSWMREARLSFINPVTWPQQAGLAAVGNWADLEALQSDLTGGRRA